MDYEKIIVELIGHFIAEEGTDYLNHKRDPVSFASLSEAENAKLTELRDKARKEVDWQGY